MRYSKKLLHLLFFALLFNNVFSQNLVFNLNWGKPKTTIINETECKKALWFESAVYLDDLNIPYLRVELGEISDDIELKTVVCAQEFLPMLPEETEVLQLNNFFPSDSIQILFEKQVKQKKTYLSLNIIPLRKNPITNLPEKLSSISIQINTTKKPTNQLLSTKKGKALDSVLKDGVFYKISIGFSGICKLGYNDLKQMGINVDNIDPRNIRIYGNGGQMLSEKSGDSRIDDLFENAIYVHDQEKGYFSPDDYILFYAPGPHKWQYDIITGTYRKLPNLYNDKSYYFITVDKGTGKRIASINHLSENAEFTVTKFLDRSHYENQTYNLIKSGKEWYGDVFDIDLTQTFPFSFPNIVTDSCVKINVSMAARASGTTSAILNAGNNSSTLSFAGTTTYTSDYAKESNTTFCSNTPQNFNLSISYNKGSSSDAKAWLNYISVSAWRNLIMNSNQMNFQNPSIQPSAQYIRYDLGTQQSLSVWDITNPLQPIRIEGNYVGTNFTFIVDNQVSKEFISFNGTYFFTPAFEGIVENQNLHGKDFADYIIISHPNFINDAKRLAEFHKEHDNLSYLIVTPGQVYNEFSSGSQDPAAIRDFVKMFYDRAANESESPKYLLLMGRASYDYKNRISNNTNFIPAFQSIESLSPTKSYASDDFYGLLDDDEGFDCNGNLDIGIGRIPASSSKESDEMVTKIIRYHELVYQSSNGNACEMSRFTPALGDWRNIVTFIGDDGDNNLHFNQAEGIISTLSNNYPYLNIDKIYLDAFPQISTPGGERAPQVNEAINQRVLKGSLIVNYTGHGGEVGWAHERILELSDISSWKNFYNMPLFITATCEFSRYDDPERIAAGELVLLNPDGGGIALFSTTRLAFSNYNENLNRSVYKIAFQKSNDEYPTLGEIFSFSKTDNGSSLYIRNFILLGDPAMRLAYPKQKVITTAINNTPVSEQSDTLSALSFVTVSGFIADENGNKLNNFNGTLTPTVYDKPFKYTTLASNPAVNTPAVFYVQKNILYKGNVSILNGDFEFSFFIPKDINYSVGNGKISYYAQNGDEDATGFFNDFFIGGSSENMPNDNLGPNIKLFLNDSTFVNGGMTDEKPLLIAKLFDESGINTTGTGIGHDIIAVLDDDFNSVYILNDYYLSDKDSFKSGIVVFPFTNLSEGTHYLFFKAWDVYNNSSTSSIEFTVSKSQNAVIKKVINYPNPFFDYTDFIFEHNQSCTPITVKIDIYNILGQHICQLEKEINSLGYRIEPLRWYGRTSDGAEVVSGTYIYQLTLTTCTGLEAKQSGKLVLLK